MLEVATYQNEDGHLTLRLALKLGFLFGAAFGLAGKSLASRAQQTTVLALLRPITGEVADAQPEQRWTVDAVEGQRLSLRMLATSGNLEPTVLTLLQPVTGEVADAQPEQRWTFDAVKGQRLSLRMLATSG